MRLKSSQSISHIALAVASGLVLSASAAAAQEATTLDRLTVEAESDDILLQDGYIAQESRTGTKTDTPIVQIPQSISVITQDQIEDQKPRTLNETLGYTASANPNQFGFDSRYDAFTLRGFPAYSTGTFRDGLRQYSGPSAWLRTEPYGIEGVTVLKGPASSLYGVSGPGGIVNIITKRPKDDFFREVEISAGSNDRAQVGVDMSGPANDAGTLLFRLTGLGRVANTHLPGYSDDKFYIAPAFTIQPDADTKLTILGELSQAVTGATAWNYNSAYGQSSEIYNGDPDWNDFTLKQGRIGYEFEHNLNDSVTLRQNLRFHAVDADLKYSGLYSVAPDGYAPPLYRYWGHYQEQAKNFVVDNMAQFDFATGEIEHTAVAGIDYSWSDYSAANRISYVGIPDVEALPFAFSGSQEQHQAGVYLHDQMEWNNWTLSASGRHDWVKSDSLSASYVEQEQTDSAFSGRIGVSYRTEWGLIPYANYSTSFSPNLGFVYDYATNSRSVAKPTTARQIEAGVKYEIPGYNAVVSAAFFNIDQTDGVIYDGTFDDAGNQRQRQLDFNSRGLELEAQASLGNGFRLLASYTYMRMEIEKGLAGTVGNELSNTPNHMASLWAHYTFSEGALAGLGLGAGVRYVGESFGDDQNTIKNEDRAFLDASLSYDFGAQNPDWDGVSLQVNAKNLLDTRKTTCTAGNCYVDEGRSIFGSLRYRF
ncbi:TonB-dependent siderophore receptor [Nitratireductor basaltis]|uniref:TonB-dependent siderophore receptor n=1 Tax=Nitratireductor basaltis TaxID=472175 RepID=A0A084U5P0_9HYPH|nr:TonB-dependent siderophore receptor [Nitratireductor basaltis]KFB08276.1 TonB-dependent siderophore receptor precursor [Nitratireductor basaltis]